MPNRSSLVLRDVEREALRLVVLGEEVDHRHVAPLAVAVAAADALLDALRVPGQVVVDDGVAELQVEALRPRLGRDQHHGPRPELVHQGQAHGDGGARPQMRSDLGLHLFPPDAQRPERAGGVVDSPEERDVAVDEIRLLEQEPAQVVLRGERFSEDHDLAAVFGPCHDEPHRLDQAVRLAVVGQGPGAPGELLHERQLAADAGHAGERRTSYSRARLGWVVGL